MKTKKIHYVAIAMALFVSSALVSCNKEPEFLGLRINAENYQTDESKTYVSGTSVHWKNGDRIRINGTECSVTVDGGNVSVTGFSGSVSDGIYAYSPASMVVTDEQTTRPTVTFPSHFESSYDANGNQIIGLPMVAYAAANSTSITFKNLSGAVLVRVRNNTANTLYIDSVKVRSSIYRLCGTRRINLTDSELGVAAYASSAPENEKSVTVTLDNTASISVGTYKEVQVPIFPVINSGQITINVYAHNNNIPGMSIVTSIPYHFNHTLGALNVARNQMCIAQISIDPNSSRVTSKYAFSVSSTNKVFFSKGNLKYTPYTNTWAFHTNQYDVASTADVASYYTETGTEPIDLFGWATSGYPQTGRSQYQPYSTHTNGGLYGFNDGTTNLTNENHGDWGCNMSSAVWRTLSQDEWEYVFNSRSHAANLRMRATVNGIPGLILLPDTWNASECGVSYTADAQNYGTNNISSSEWATMQSYGAVFLPAAGYRDFTTVYSAEESGFYWTSDVYDGTKAKFIMFKASTRNFGNNNKRSLGMCVRLVTDAN